MRGIALIQIPLCQKRVSNLNKICNQNFKQVETKILIVMQWTAMQLQEKDQ